MIGRCLTVVMECYHKQGHNIVYYGWIERRGPDYTASSENVRRSMIFERRMSIVPIHVVGTRRSIRIEWRTFAVNNNTAVHTRRTAVTV
jgi:hypothetical protein